MVHLILCLYIVSEAFQLKAVVVHRTYIKHLICRAVLPYGYRDNVSVREQYF